MKRIYFLIAGLLLFSGAMAQTQEKPASAKDTPFYKHFHMKYIYAMRYNDWRTAANALYDLVVIDPANDSLKLNLAYLYFENNIYPSALFISNDVLSRMPNDETALSISAAAYDNMGLKDKAIDNYETLYLANSDINLLFRISAMQYELKRYTEAMNNAKIVSENAKSKELKLAFPKNETEQQEVPLTAAAYNLMGVIQKDQGNKTQAKEFFNKALSIAPDFQLAKDGLKEVQ